MEYPVCTLIADSCVNNTKVLNKQTLNAFIYIEIPPKIAQNCALIGVSEIVPKFKRLEDYAETFIPQDNYPWVRVQSDKLNVTPGMHVYDLEYVDTFSNATMSLYFAYILQDDDPEKLYIYMTRQEEE